MHPCRREGCHNAEDSALALLIHGQEWTLAAIHQLQEKLMATFADLTQHVNELGTVVNRLDADFQALKVALASGNLTPEQQAALDAADASVQALTGQVNTDDPAPAPAP